MFQWLKGALLPLALLAFVGLGIRYLDVVFTTSSRWVFLAILVASLLPRGEIMLAYRSRFAPFLLAYFLWCFATAAWSSLPLLSLLKSGALVITATAFLAAGHSWARSYPPERAIFLLLPITAVGLLAGLFAPGAQSTGSGLTIYQGLTGNPNYLGLVAAMALPFPLYAAFAFRRSGELIQIATWVVLAALAFILWRSGSRASILCAFTMLAIFALAVSPGRRLSLIVMLVAAATLVSLAAPEIKQGVVERVVVKSTTGSDIFMSRRVTWQKSYEAAEQGGLTGLGYGVSAGYSDFSVGLTANRYGREKGNSQLAVWEETGLVGLALYAFLLITIFRDLLAGLLELRGRDDRAAAGLMIGALAGLVVQSCFEAWWTSPGSVESSLFWSILGLATGFLQRRTVGAAVRTGPALRTLRPFDRVPIRSAQPPRN